MASFPGAVKSFTSHNAGDVIQPSHVNDLQDEVNAIEGGLLNGTAPLNSSNSTFANLSIPGKSTFAGNVQMNGNSSIAGNLVVAGTITGTFSLNSVQTVDAQPRIRVFHGSTQTIATGAETALTFNSEDFDPQGLHSTASNPTRINCTSTGVWLFGAVCNMITGGVSGKYIRFIKNSTTAVGAAAGAQENAGVGFGQRIHHTVIDVITSTSDWMEVRAFQNTGSNLESGNASSRIDQNEFWAVKLW